MSTLFKVAQPFEQIDDLMIHYKDSDGLCMGLALEYARHHFAHQTKVTPSNFINKLRTNTESPSANFLERVQAYQNYYQLAKEGVIYRTDAQLTKLVHSNSDELLLLMLSAINTEADPHAIVVKTEHVGGVMFYKIFDPNLGESIGYSSKEDCIEALIHLKQLYLSLWSCENISITAIDIKPIIDELGLTLTNGAYTKDSKYAYRIIDAIKNNDLTKIHGNLGALTKLDYKGVVINGDDAFDSPVILKPENPIELAILRLSEPDLIKLININTQMDLTKSLPSVLLALYLANKATPDIIDALIAKLPSANHEFKELLEGLKHCALKPDKGTSLVSIETTRSSEWFLKECVKEMNSATNFDLSRFKNEDSELNHYYTITIGPFIELHADMGISIAD